VKVVKVEQGMGGGFEQGLLAGGWRRGGWDLVDRSLAVLSEVAGSLEGRVIKIQPPEAGSSITAVEEGGQAGARWVGYHTRIFGQMYISE
jgi:hypothetical protein